MNQRPDTRTERQKIIDATRDEWQSYKRKHAAIQQRAERVLQTDGRWKTLIRCQCCQQLFRREEIEANHINPVGPLKSTKPEDVAEYRARMFCRTSEIEPLCKPCHRMKTNTHRKQHRKEQYECTSASPATEHRYTTIKTPQIVLSGESNSS